MFQTDLKKFFVINRVKKNNCALTIVISDLKGEEIVGKFYEKQLQKNKSNRV